MINRLKGVVVIALSFLLMGCPAAALVPMLFAYSPSLVGSAIDLSKGQYKDIELVMGKGVNKSDLNKISSVAFLVGSGGQNFFAPGSGTLFADNLTKEFMRLGFQVVDRGSLEATVDELKFQRGNFANNKNLSKIGRVVGANGIFKGSVQSGQDFSTGFMGMGAGMTSGITAATLTLVDIETTKVLLMVSATFKKPKAASEVAKDVAEAFKQYRDYKEPEGGAKSTENKLQPSEAEQKALD